MLLLWVKLLLYFEFLSVTVSVFLLVLTLLLTVVMVILATVHHCVCRQNLSNESPN